MFISNIGMPSIGRNRETKKAVEQFWEDGDSDLLSAKLKCVRSAAINIQKEAGIDLIPVFDQDPYDRLLRHAVMFGAVSKRFGSPEEIAGSFNNYFSVPRGTVNAPAAAMIKWFNTNYHCVRPEIESGFKITRNFALEAFQEFSSNGINPKPALIGPLTFCYYSNIGSGKSFNQTFDELSDNYIEIIDGLTEAGAKFIQIEEPVLVFEYAGQWIENLSDFWQKVQKVKRQAVIILQTYFEGIDHIYQQLLDLPIDGIGMDFVSSDKNLEIVSSSEFPSNMWLAAGIVDGRGVWSSNYDNLIEKTELLLKKVSSEKMIIQPSCSLLHLPYSIEDETGIDDDMKGRLAFAIERMKELKIISQVINKGIEPDRKLYPKTKGRTPSLNSVLDKIKESDFSRPTPRNKRLEIQQKTFPLPVFPTTTIGSFPQISDIRKARLALKKGDLSQEEYSNKIKERIKKWISIQEELDIDLLVHGEFERSDMVAFFAEQLDGITPIKGWVQSYGTRYVRPPVVTGDISFVEPMTVEWTKYAQSLTKKPVKGILTGPVTILNWSYARPDITRKEQTIQLALALKREVSHLVQAGVKYIQIDEPALREGLPLKKTQMNECLEWSVNAFKLVSSGVPDSVQIHTHICFSEFKNIVYHLDNMDADVLSVEDSKQGGVLASSLFTENYQGSIGLGVYDVHSPRVPSADEMMKIPETVLKVVSKDRIWINPDCGLKTRTDEEAVSQLKNMVDCAKRLRASCLVII